jgi:hypothetical protein
LAINIDQTSKSIDFYTAEGMDNLSRLQSEYDEITKLLACPVDVADLKQLQERRLGLVIEARRLGVTLRTSEFEWFSYLDQSAPSADTAEANPPDEE